MLQASSGPFCSGLNPNWEFLIPATTSTLLFKTPAASEAVLDFCHKKGVVLPSIPLIHIPMSPSTLVQEREWWWEERNYLDITFLRPYLLLVPHLIMSGSVFMTFSNPQAKKAISGSIHILDHQDQIDLWSQLWHSWSCIHLLWLPGSKNNSMSWSHV